MRVPVVIYAAKSTQDKHKSIPTQLEDGRQKAAEEDWEIVGEFEDEGFSAYSGNRGPGLEQAKALAAATAEERGVVCMLAAQASDRFARGAGDKPGAAESLIEIWHALRRRNVHLRSVEDDFDLRDSASVANLGHRAMLDSRRKSGSVKKGVARRTHDKGMPTGGTRAFGYRWADDESGLVVIRHEASVVRHRIYEATLAGVTQLQIMRELEADGIAPVGGRRWHQGAISRMLGNPLYKGMFLHKGEELRGHHEPIVSPELWSEVAVLRAARVKSGKGRGRPPKGRHLFRKGMLTCLCGEALVPRTSRTGKSAKAGAYEGYVCYGKHRDPSACSMPALPRAEIDTAVYRYFEQVGLDIEATRAQLAESRASKLVEVKALRAQAQTEKRKAEERLGRVRRDYTEGKLAAEDWAEFKQELGTELQAAIAEVERLAEQQSEAEDWAEFQDAERDVLVKLADLRAAIAGEVKGAAGVEGVRAALTRLFEGFTLRRVEPGMRVHADLAWKGEYVLDPIVRPQAIEGYTSLRPVFRREPLYDGETIIRGSRRAGRRC